MNALSQSQFNEALYLTELAHRILDDGPSRALGANLSDREERECVWLARDYLNALNDGLEDDGEFAAMVDDHFNPARDRCMGALDSDFLHDEQAEWRAVA